MAHSSSPPSSPYKAYLFGTLALSYTTDTLPLPGSSDARRLLAYLLLQRQQPHARLVLMGHLWPDWAEDRGRRALRQALWQLRRHLLHVIQTEGHTIQIPYDAPIWDDVTAFRAQMAAYRRQPLPTLNRSATITMLQKAVAYYRGDLLEGFYDDWILLEREQLRLNYLDLIEQLIILLKQQQNFQDARRYAQQLVTADPLREQTHQELMRLHTLLGQPQQALAQYDQLQAILAAELGAEPGKTSMTLRQEIVTQFEISSVTSLPSLTSIPAAPLFDSAGALPLIGRQVERAALLTDLNNLGRQQGQLILLAGEAGIGKTRLLQELAQDAEWRSVRVLWGQSRRTDRAIPYHSLLEALTPILSPLRVEQLALLVEGMWLRVVSQLLLHISDWLPDLPPLPPLEPEQAQTRLLEALTRIIFGLATIEPILLILEDLHDADENTLAVLQYLSRQLSNQQFMIVGSYRPPEAKQRPEIWQALQRLDLNSACKRLPLSPLSDQESSLMIQQGLGLPQAAPFFERRLYQETRGNPFFLLEMLRSLYDEGLLYQDEAQQWHTRWDETTADYTELPLPSTIKSVILRRVTALPANMQRLLKSAAVLARDITLQALLQVGQLSQTETLQAVSGLTQRRLLVDEATHYLFSHDKIQQTVYADIPPDERQQLHKRAAIMLETSPPHQAGLLAYHYEQAACFDKAITYHHLAGEQAQALQAVTTARYHFDVAVNLAQQINTDPSEYLKILLAREAVLNLLGDREAQTADLETMLQLVPANSPQRAEIYRRQAWLLGYLSQFEAAEQSVRQVLKLAKSQANEGLQVEALLILGHIFSWRGDPSQAIPYLTQALNISPPQSNQQQEAKIHAALAMAWHLSKRLPQARKEAETALALYQTLDDPVSETEILGTLASICMEEGYNQEADRHHRRVLEICRRIGYRYMEGRTLTNWGNVLYLDGQLSQALAHYDQASEIFQIIGNTRGELAVRLNAASVYHMMVGDDDTAKRQVQQVLSYAQQQQDYISIGHGLGILGSIALKRKDFKRARTYLNDAVTAIRKEDEKWLEIQMFLALIDLGLAEKEPAQALAELEQAEALSQILGMPHVETQLLAWRGKVLLALGQAEAGLVATTQAMDGLESGVDHGHLIPFIHSRALTALNRHAEAQAAVKQSYQMLQTAIQGLSPEQKAISLTQISNHRDIVAAWQTYQPVQTTVRLPHCKAPTGRPLRDDEWVTVTWSLKTTEDDTISGKAARRQHRLLRLLQEAEAQQAAPTVPALAKALQVTTRTIKRDLAALRQAGHSVQTRGSRSV